jgi:hypothetical protein
MCSIRISTLEPALAGKARQTTPHWTATRVSKAAHER